MRGTCQHHARRTPQRRQRPIRADPAPRRPAGRPGGVERAAVEPDGAPVEPAGASSEPDPAAGSWTPTPAATEAGGVRYTPTPEARADWAGTWDQVAPVTPERWYEPAPSPDGARRLRQTSRWARRRVAGRGRAPVRGPGVGWHSPRAQRGRRTRSTRRHGDDARGAPTRAPSSRSPSMSRRRRSRSRPTVSPAVVKIRSRAPPTPATSGSSRRPASGRASSSTATAGS